MSDANTSIVVTGNAETAPSGSGQRTFPAYCQTCRLLTLPAELRLHINKLVLVQGPLGRLSTLQEHTLRWPSIHVHQNETKNIALLATCQQIHDEAVETFYSYNTFIFPTRVQDLAGCIQPQPTFSLMQYFHLRPFSCERSLRGGNEELPVADACIRVIMGSCPAVKLVKIDVNYSFVKEAAQKWEILDRSPDLVWYTFQAFPMWNKQQTALLAVNSKRMDEIWKGWDFKAFMRKRGA